MDKRFCKMWIALLVFLLSSINDSSAAEYPNSAVIPADQHLDLSTILERTSIIYALTTVSNTSIVNSNCHNELQFLRKSVLQKEPWALKVFDASGRPSPGFMIGDNFWLGSHLTCEAAGHGFPVKVPLYLEKRMNKAILTDQSPFEVDFYIVYMTHNSSWQTEQVLLFWEPNIHLGLCMPKSCNLIEIKSLVTGYMFSALYKNSDIYETNPRVVEVKDLHLSPSFYQRTSIKYFCGFVGFSLIMALVAFFLRNNSIPSMKVDQPKESTKGQSNEEVAAQQSSQSIVSPTIHAIIGCFDPVRNFHNLFIIPVAKKGRFDHLNGIRVIFTIFVLYYHVNLYGINAVTNPSHVLFYTNNFGSMEVIVDVFFICSGFLQGYGFMRSPERIMELREASWRKCFKTVLFSTCYRYLRFAPILFLSTSLNDMITAIIAQTSVYKYFGTGKFDCSKNWWRTVLLIQNLKSSEYMCLEWTWQQCVDMQAFIVVTILFVIYAKRPILAKILGFLFCCCFVIFTLIAGIRANYQLTLESTFANTTIYTHSFIRSISYFLGAGAAVLYLENHLRLRYSRLSNKIFPILAVVIIFILESDSPFGWGYIPAIDTLLLIWQRIILALTFCYLIIALARGHCKWMGNILGSMPFQKLSQFLLPISMLNPFVIFYIFAFTTRAIEMSNTMTVVAIIGTFFFNTILSVIAGLFFEIPYDNLRKLVLLKGMGRKKQA